MSNALLADSIKATEVAAYLRDHPGFLSEYPDLASQLTVPREQGAVSSLAAYQLQNLRDKNAELERRLADLVQIASENEKLMQRVHDLNVTMLHAGKPADAVNEVIAKLDTEFHIEEVRLVLFGNPLNLPPGPCLLIEAGATAMPEFSELLAHHEPITGRIATDRLQRLFGDHATDIRSAALMPLGDLGLLAFGSHDADHFQPGMGTLFLKMIAATVTASLTRAQGAA